MKDTGVYIEPCPGRSALDLEGCALGATSISSGIQLSKGDRAAVRSDDSAVLSSQQSRLWHPAGVRDGLYFALKGSSIVCNALAFLAHHQPPLQPLVMGRDTCGTGIFIALKSLNTAQRKHKASGRDRKVTAHAEGPGYLAWARELTAGDNANTLPQPMPHPTL